MGGSLALTDMFLDTHRHLTGHLSASKHLIHAYGCGDVRFLFIKKRIGKIYKGRTDNIFPRSLTNSYSDLLDTMEFSQFKFFCNSKIINVRIFIVFCIGKMYVFLLLDC
jgi:hypothetical protein